MKDPIKKATTGTAIAIATFVFGERPPPPLSSLELSTCEKFFGGFVVKTSDDSTGKGEETGRQAVARVLRTANGQSLTYIRILRGLQLDIYT